MLKLLSEYRIISIIGTGKNVGKTTTLNYLLKNLYGKKKIGLTSVGRDGEKIDIVTSTSKPQIYIEAGSIIATARLCLGQSDFTKQVLETTDINTPLGQIVIVKALSDGYADLAGPSYNEGMKRIIDIFKKYGAEMILIDGAAGRKGLADSYVSEAAILATGASVSTNIEEVVSVTKSYVDMLCMPVVPDIKQRERFRQLLDKGNVWIIDADDKETKLPLNTVLNNVFSVCERLSSKTRFLLLKGALTSEMLTYLVSHKNDYKELDIVILNGTRCFIHENLLLRLKQSNIRIFVLDPVRLICLTYNPKSPYNYEFDDACFKKALETVINIPVYNVLRE